MRGTLRGRAIPVSFLSLRRAGEQTVSKNVSKQLSAPQTPETRLSLTSCKAGHRRVWSMVEAVSLTTLQCLDFGFPNPVMVVALGSWGKCSVLSWGEKRDECFHHPKGLSCLVGQSPWVTGRLRLSPSHVIPCFLPFP